MILLVLHRDGIQRRAHVRFDEPGQRIIGVINRPLRVRRRQHLKLLELDFVAAAGRVFLDPVAHFQRVRASDQLDVDAALSGAGGIAIEAPPQRVAEDKRRRLIQLGQGTRSQVLLPSSL